MKQIIYLTIFCILAFTQIACGQIDSSVKQTKKESSVTNNYPNLKFQADEVGKATLEGDFEKLVDYTHPKVVEKLGGKEKMVAFLKQDSGQMKPEGFELVSVDVNNVKQIENIDNHLFSIIPMNLTINSPQGKFSQESYLIGISSNNGETWKFISGVSRERFRLLFPNVADKLEFPDIKQPIKIEN